MMLHFPPYSSGDHGSHLGVQEPVTQLAKRHGVELVITGHDHNYERTVEIEGTTYIVSGSAGAPIRAVRPQWFTAHARTEPHYVLIDVEGHRMTLRAVNLKGEVFDTHIIEPNPPQP
jgi:Icc-related predicted phosphoesterase